MNIAAEKVNKNDFKDIYELVDKYKWLRTPVDALIDLWNSCDTQDQRSLIKELINRFTFIDMDQLEKISIEILNKIEEWDMQPSNTFIAAIADEGEADGSTAGLVFLRNKFPVNKGWKESYFIPTIVKVSHEIRSNDNLVIFDDFIGTGKTLKRKIEYVQKILSERKIKLKSMKVCAFAGMEFGVKEVQDKTGVEVYTPVLIKKGISEIDTPEVSSVKKDLMKDIEKKLKSKSKGLYLRDHSLGYNGTEALFSIHGYNCPNSVFPIFWWPESQMGEYRDTLLKRAR